MSSPTAVVIPGFLSKLYEIFNSNEFRDCCRWGATEESIVVFEVEIFSKKVLPKYFKHSNYASFVRQLNMYVPPPPHACPAKRRRVCS